MLKLLLVSLSVLLLVLFAGCGGDDDDEDAPNGGSTGSGASPELEAQIESVLLKQEEVPVGLQAGGLTYTTNEQLAGSSQEELDRLNQIGRLLSGEITFVPTQNLGPEVAARGGIQNSAGVYETPAGAGETYTMNSEAALTSDWAAAYSDFDDVRWGEIDRSLGDESTWIRITGLEECIVETPTPGPGAPSPGPVPTCAIPQQVIIDQLVIRAGRTYIYFQATSSVPAGSVEDVFVGQVEVWAQAVVGRANATFP
jgi:hypothetical protein